MGKDDRKGDFLCDLGRATMRGLRKCKKCGTMNGTRGFTCKNNACDAVFKDPQTTKKPDNDAVKIKTSKNLNLYSVRSKDKGLEHRGFVLIPNCQVVYSGIENSTITESRCHIEACNRNKYGHNTVCQHIQGAQECYREAKPLALKQSVINSLPIPSNFKNEIWQLSVDTTGPVVQRVSKTVMVVKCTADNLNPLGYLHIRFVQPKHKRNGERNGVCSCKTYKNLVGSKGRLRSCLHVYACIVAFQSNEDLAQEFSYFINLIKENRHASLTYSESLKSQLSQSDFTNTLESVVCKEPSIRSAEVDSLETVDERSFLILRNHDDENGPCQVEVEVLQDSPDALDAEEEIDSKLEIQLQTDDGLQFNTEDGGTISVHQFHDTISLSGVKRKFDDHDDPYISEGLRMVARKIASNSDAKKLPMIANRKSRDSDEAHSLYSFYNWMENIVERMEQYMQFGLSSTNRQAAVVVAAPKVFAKLLLNRLNKIVDPKRPKTTTETCTRTEAPPYGRFTKYAWKLQSSAHVCQMFSTPNKTLSTTLYYSLGKDGNYNICQPPASLIVQSVPGTPIKPQEHKTVMRIGPSPYNSKHNEILIIEYVPGLWPATETGEITIRFEYDYYNNGQLVAFKNANFVPKAKSVRSLGPPLAPKPPAKSTSTVLGVPFGVGGDLGVGDFTILTF